MIATSDSCALGARWSEDDEEDLKRLYSILQCLFALHRMELDERYDTFDGNVHTIMKGNRTNGTRWGENRLIIEVAIGSPRTPVCMSEVPARTAARTATVIGIVMQAVVGNFHRKFEGPEHWDL